VGSIGVPVMTASHGVALMVCSSSASCVRRLP
jgi:hypothetical protein